MADPFRGLEDRMSEWVLQWWRSQKSKLEQNDWDMWTDIPRRTAGAAIVALSGHFKRPGFGK